MLNPTTRPRPVHATPASARGFSLIELLVVIVIIGLIVSIVLPAIASARKSARKSDTLSMCNALSQACSQFILDERRAPGYFSQREMGSQENVTRGFSQMENAMLDLAGGIFTGTAETGDLRDVGPTANSAVRIIRPSLIGSGNGKAYFSPRPKYFRVQDGTDGGSRSSSNDNNQMPVLVDTDGMPILMWTADDRARTKMRSISGGERGDDLVRSLFARETSDEPANAAPVRFYWASNSAFLSGNRDIGKPRINQTAKSVLGAGVPVLDRSANLGAILGNPNTPLFPPRPRPADNAAANEIEDYARDTVPSDPRGSVIIQAAGANHTYFGVSERGASRGSRAGVMYFGYTFVPGPSQDLAAGFDDIILSAN